MKVRYKDKDQKYWCYEANLKMRSLGGERVRVVISYDNPELNGESNFYCSNKLDLKADKMLNVYAKRWKIDSFYRDAKQNLGMEDYEMRKLHGPSGLGRFTTKRLVRVFDVKRVQAFLVDETYVKVGSFEAWVWVAVEPIHRYILGVHLSRHQNILVAQIFLKSLVEKYGKHVVYSDGGTWYPEACSALGLEHRLHPPYEKSLMERANEYLKDRIEEFDDYYPCMKKEGCDLRHVNSWLNLFVDIHYARRRHLTFGDMVAFLLGGDAS